MMTRTLKVLIPLVVAGVLVTAGSTVSASGPIGIYGIVQRVVFEPNEQKPERLQVWGAFAYAEGGPQGGGQASPARKGYLYFSMPAGDPKLAETVTKEWMDLKAVAGTRQTVGFGTWGYIGGFGALDPSVKSNMPPYILEMYPGRGVQTDLRVRPATEKPSAPAVYQTNVGLVKIPATGSRADLVRALQLALDAP
jgi:hypothetical protein